MGKSDAKLSKAEVRRMIADIERQGWPAAAVEFWSREPALAEHVADAMAQVQHKLGRSCFKGSLEKLNALVARLSIEPLLVLDLAHRRLWEGVLPQDDELKSRPPQYPIQSKPRRTFATTEFTPAQVRAIRPDMSEWQCQIFLMYRELEIGSAMYNAGWAIMQKLLKDYEPGGGKP
jgi:hypothetical protein